MKCEKFQYGGCLGNQNNFHTLKECQDTCEDNLRSANSLQITDMLVSTTNNTTPVVKQESVLLPSLCVMRRDRGLCKANEKRFFYNLTTGKCHPFNYSGCGGNENNFTSRKSCLQMCKKESVLLPSLCVMRRDRGLCKANEKRFFYNLTTGKCHPFNYSGCGGNENNFTSRKSCLQMCKKESVLLPSLCVMRRDRGLCKANEKRFFYNLTTGKCHPFNYSGCGGNENNFTSRKSCLQMCKKESVLLPSLCVMRRDRGLCKANEKRFFYSLTTGKCHPFSYSGCGGNENNFTSRKSCLQMCKKGFQGRMKIRRKRKKQAKLIDGEIVIERI
uniref:Tissue factor pathway inhibitor n=1 Tax=Podarcis muralis TaxID=64176 RepID=A0A670HX63_PODMU